MPDCASLGHGRGNCRGCRSELENRSDSQLRWHRWNRAGQCSDVCPERWGREDERENDDEDEQDEEGMEERRGGEMRGDEGRGAEMRRE
eukprot:9494123-Pyramimonas_sp.AAC.1